MKKCQREKNRKRIYQDIIEDIALEISLDSYWRNKIFSLPVKERLEISYIRAQEIPKYIKKEMIGSKLVFWVEKVKYCNEDFNDNLIIFKISSKEYPKIFRFTGNNPEVI